MGNSMGCLSHIFMSAVFEDALRFLHNLPHAQDFVVVGSSAAAFQGALGRSAHDIDVLVTSKAAWQWLAEQFGPSKFVQTGAYKGSLIVAEYINPEGEWIEIEFTKSWQFQEPQAGRIAPREELIHGIRVAWLLDVLAAKTVLGRAKDAEDIDFLGRCLQSLIVSTGGSMVAKKAVPTIRCLEKSAKPAEQKIITLPEGSIYVPGHLEHNVPVAA